MGQLIKADDITRWARKPNPFRDLVVMYPYAPIVTQTFRKFDAPRLIKILIDYFDVRHAFSASECMRLDEVRELMDISVKAFGGRLGEIAGENFDGYRIEKIDEDRNGAIWWVSESS